MNLRCALLLLFALTIPDIVQAQTRLADLPKQAASWPPAWGALAREVAETPDNFEKRAIAGVDKLLKAGPSPDAYRRADTILSATLRHHLSIHRPSPFGEESERQTRVELQDRLASVRQAWLESLDNDPEALRLADAWLSATPINSLLRSTIQQLWIHQAKQALSKNDFKSARLWLNRIEADFDDAKAEPIGKALRERATALLKEAQAQEGAQAIRTLEEALEYWPRLPDARDALERQKGTYRTLVVGVPALPAQLSPGAAWTEVEKQSLSLLFDALYQPEQVPVLGRRYYPELARALTTDPGLTSTIPLRRDVFWSSGEQVTAADVRHTALLTNKEDGSDRSGLWREYLDVPRPGTSRFQVEMKRRQGLLDPLAPLTFWVLPQYYRGQQLQRLDDADFAKAPIGSGPFVFIGRKADAGKPYLHFQANPCDLRGGIRHLREIRMIAWTDAMKDLSKPLPELIIDAPTDQLTALKSLGYAEVRVDAPPAVQFLAVNQRRPGLTSALIRRAIGHGLDRQALLRRHFQGAAQPHHATANGLFPRQSWASCPRVPAELFQQDLAKSLARKAKGEFTQFDWTLKYAVGDAHVQAACEEMAATIAKLFNEAGIKTSVKAIGLAPAEVRKALAERDYDLLYRSDEHLDDPVRLALLFDPNPNALKAGGSNYLGCDDVRLQELLQDALRHRQFAPAQDGMYAVHVHLNSAMPAIPLWQLDFHVLAQPSLRMAPLSSRQLLSRIRAWKS